MSDVLHHARYTPTQQAAIYHQTRFRSNIEERAKARIPIQCVQPEAVPTIPSGDLVFGPIVLPYQRAETWEVGPTMQAVIRATSVYFRTSKTDICSQRRERHLVRVRQVAAYLCHTLTERSLPAIAKQLGDRDHTTILHAVRKIQGYILSNDPEIIGAIDALTAELAPNQS